MSYGLYSWSYHTFILRWIVLHGGVKMALFSLRFTSGVVFHQNSPVHIIMCYQFFFFYILRGIRFKISIYVTVRKSVKYLQVVVNMAHARFFLKQKISPQTQWNGLPECFYSMTENTIVKFFDKLSLDGYCNTTIPILLEMKQREGRFLRAGSH